MEQKQFLWSALGVGVGVGVGLGLASPTVSKWTGVSSSNVVTGDKLERELARQVIDGREAGVTFAEFPYYLSDQTRVLLTSAAYVHLKHAEVSKYTRNLSPASRTILLSGPAELYQQMLAKALAHYFDAKLLLLDITDFSFKIVAISHLNKQALAFQGFSKSSSMERLSDFLGSLSILQQDKEPKGMNNKLVNSSLEGIRGMEDSSNLPKLRRNASAAANMNTLASQSTSSNTGYLLELHPCEYIEVKCILNVMQVLAYVSKTSPIVLYLRDVDKFLSRSQRIYNFFHKMLNKLSGSVLILGSRSVDLANEYREADEKLTFLFPYNVEIQPPEDENQHINWKSQLEEDMKMIQVQDNRNHIAEVLSANDLDCDDLDSICMADTMVLSNYIEEIVVSAISYHLMNNKDPDYRNGKLIISSTSLSHGLSIFQEGKSVGKGTLKLEAQAELPKVTNKEGTEPAADVKPEAKAETIIPEKKDEPGTPRTVKPEASKAPEVLPDNEFEKRIRPEVIPADEINVTFADIGSLEEIKESLQELVMLPLRRPDLFKGGLLKPCRGILLFGPPGTGKTMLAKAIAREAGASFINVSMSTITSKWFGEDEKNVRALFSLAAKVSPTIIFVDEVDSMLGQRTRVGEHEAMRKIKNEFMTHWDGLATKQGERILVLAATNRPFDLDEAIIRRFERRIMVGLPSVENREMILKTLLSKEKVDEQLDFKELATLTEGFSGSDLKNLCTTAAYRPVRELIQQERSRDMEKKEKKKKAAEAQKPDETTEAQETKEERVITLRPLNMEDFRLAKNQVAASFASGGSIMAELKQWNELYGEGGSRKKEQLSYFM
ncbi:Outer mitochondrial transmembrane helix translocase [Linum perenne]